MSTNSFKIKNSAVLTPKDLSTLVSPEAGEIACDINDSNKIKRYDAASASWVEVGSGGVGSVDIMFVQDFESASLSSFTQTGLSLSTTNPLHGKVSAVLTHQAAVNQSFKQVIPVDPKFRGQAMVLDLNVKSAASAGNVVIKVRDESNSSDLIVSEALQLSNDVSGRRSSVSFTIPSTCSSLSYTITALPEAGSPVTRIDDIVAMLSDVSLLETSVLVPNLTAWQGYTPTFQGFGTPSNVEFEWRQVGENVEIRGKFTSGAPTAVEARIGLPGGLTSAGTSLIPSLQMVGKAGHSGSAATYFGKAILIEPSVSYMTVGTQTSTSNELTKAQGINLLATGDTLSFFASVPCAGLSATSTKTIPLTQSGLVQEGDSYLFVSGNAGQAITASVTNIPFANIQSSIGDAFSFNGSQITILKAGVFDFSATVTTSANVSTRLGLFKNGNLVSTGVGALISTHSYSLSLSLSSGDVISFRLVDNNGTLANSTAHTLQVTQQSSLKQVSVSSDQKITIPTSELRFEGASSRGSTATAIVKFDTMAKLRGDAFTVESDSVLGTRITMKKAGKLDVSANVRQSAAATYFSISKNQANLTAVATIASEVLAFAITDASTSYENMSWSGFVSVGDIIRVSAGANPTNDLSQSLNLSFQEQDISVSVTNTLPQFSESDSYVRVATGNGFGSSATTVRRFASVTSNVGTDILYADSATAGASFTVQSAGVYNISYTDQSSSSTPSLQILINSVIISQATIPLATGSITATAQPYLNRGDIIQLIATPAANMSSASSLAQVLISKVGKPNVTGVDVTPFVNVPQPDSQSSYFSSSATLAAGTIIGALQSNTNNGIFSYNPSTGIYTMLKNADVSISASVSAAAAATVQVLININGVSTNFSNTEAILNRASTVSLNQTIQAGSTFYIFTAGGSSNTTRISVLATALSDQILTAPESFSTDTASLSYASSAAYTLSTLQNAPVGTYITFTYAANTNTRTQTTTRPTQTDADMNVNGMLIYTRAYNAASTAGNPAAIAIQIGKGLKGVSKNLYKSVGKSIEGSVDAVQFNTGSLSGIAYKAYNEVTGILYIDSGEQKVTTSNSNFFSFSDLSTQSSGYLVINASKNPALTGLNVLLPRIATLSDVKASGTAGGTATSGSYQTRTLNTLSDPTGIVTSLASNQFTLPAGEYYIEAEASAFGVLEHKAKIRNITNSSDSLMGTSEYSNTASTTGTKSSIKGSVVITSSTVFEIQHRVASTKAVNGFGTNATFGDNEVYSILKIQKIK